MNKKKLDELNKGVDEMIQKSEAKDETIRRLSLELSIAKSITESVSKNPELVDKILGFLEKTSEKGLSTSIEVLNVKDFPTSFEIKNTEEFKSVEISNIDEVVKRLDKIVAKKNPDKFSITGFGKAINLLLAEIKSIGAKVFKAAITGEVKITNKTVEESIPVRLVSQDERFFYNALVSIAGSGGANMADGLLQQILVAIQASSSSTVPTEIGDGSQSVTTAGTRVQLSGSSVPCKRVHIQAKVGNTGSIYVGGVTIAAGRGTELFPTASITLNIDDLDNVYLDSSVNGEGVTYTYEN